MIKKESKENLINEIYNIMNMCKNLRLKQESIKARVKENGGRISHCVDRVDYREYFKMISLLKINIDKTKGYSSLKLDTKMKILDFINKEESAIEESMKIYKSDIYRCLNRVYLCLLDIENMLN